MSGNELKKEFGDYQTPKNFAEEVCCYLYNSLNIRPKTIIEPTAGIGNFIGASLKQFDESKKIIGIEINREYCDICRQNHSDNRITIECENFFRYNLRKYSSGGDDTLVVGNPPWATNSELNYNLPEKINFKKLSGTDAITGASNFDICEYIILQLITAFKDTNATIAMLCKTSVARNVLQELDRTSVKTDYIKMINFNANKVFGISASACLFVIKLSRCHTRDISCEVSDFCEPDKVLSIIKSQDGILSTETEGVKDFGGSCQYEWRQGVKHDCSSIMELEKIETDKYKNKKKEEIELEETLVFPLLKSSGFKKPIICNGFKKYVIVTQRKPREDTSYIKGIAPNTWGYLSRNKSLFDARKSSIYNGAPAFSMFGVGDYSFAKYKVGISGFYKKPLFSLLYNETEVEHPIMLDDTAYFLSFDTYDEAYTCMLLLNCESVQEFLYSISFKDAKRPYTKKVLQHLDLQKCVKEISMDEMRETEARLELPPYINENIYRDFKQLVR